jgi:hypothetical protein
MRLGPASQRLAGHVTRGSGGMRLVSPQLYDP